jgi:NADH-quinone oxidoreductase subunit N
MVSLAGIPPLAGFFGKFLLFKAALEAGQTDPLYYGLVGVAIFGVVVSLYFYLGVVRTIYWPKNPPSTQASTPAISLPMKWALSICMVAMILLGIAPRLLLQACQLVASASFNL